MLRPLFVLMEAHRRRRPAAPCPGRSQVSAGSSPPGLRRSRNQETGIFSPRADAAESPPLLLGIWVTDIFNPNVVQPTACFSIPVVVTERDQHQFFREKGYSDRGDDIRHGPACSESRPCATDAWQQSEQYGLYLRNAVSKPPR